MICDVPCSGLGVIRKKPDIRYKDLGQISGLPEVQRRILETQSAYVKPGGALLYSTCTIAGAENQGNAKWFAAHFPVKKCFEKLYLPDDHWPGDGFYAAVFERI